MSFRPATCWLAAAFLIGATPAAAQMSGHQHHGHAPPAPRDSITRTAPRRPTAAPHRTHAHPAARDTTRTGRPHEHPGMHHAMPGMSHEMPMTHGHAMRALYGSYPMSREASGTAWQPDQAPHRGRHLMAGPWTGMLHGDLMLALDRQGGPRGDDEVFSSNMLMAMLARPLGAGRFGARAMVSLEPSSIGDTGYPLLLQTGETADGRTPLIDRQHPHDAFMELAVSWAVSDATRSAFVYAGLPGEPALGPPAFMHRFSGMAFPEAPITHHWLDSTHITFGVVTLGGIVNDFKLEASAFRGREPDQRRWNIEEPKLDSHALRASWNPSSRWALQASFGRLRRPEQLEPDVDVDRSTASAIYSTEVRGTPWQTTIAWGRNRKRPGSSLDATMIESALELGPIHTLLARAERVEKDELFEAPDPRAGRPFAVGKLTGGWIADVVRSAAFHGGIGVAGTVSLVPKALQDVYDENPKSVLFFLRFSLR